MKARKSRRSVSRRAGFTIVEMLTTVAVLIIVLGLMVSLARHVRAASADQSTRDILHQLDEAMVIYIQRNDGQPPDVPLLLNDDPNVPAENELKLAALRNNQAFVRALNNAGLLAGRFDDLSIAYFDETQVRDSWGTPIVFMPHMHPAVGMNPRGWFFFSAGPDRQFLTRADNLYSYEQPTEQQ